MRVEQKETYIMAPTIIVTKARELYNVGLYEQALELLNRNKVIFDVYPTHVETRLPSIERRRKLFLHNKSKGQ